MTKSSKLYWVRSITCLGLIATVLMSTSLTAMAVPGRALGGEIMISGTNAEGAPSSVLLNGEPVMTGRTFLSSGLISTPETKTATVDLGKLGRVTLSPASTLSLNLADNRISGTLSAGEISVDSNEGVTVNIQTPEGTIENDAATAGSFIVALRGGKTVASATSGRATMDGWKTVVGQTKDDDDDDDNKGGLFIYAAIVGTVIIAILVSDDDDDENRTVSPVR